MDDFVENNYLNDLPLWADDDAKEILLAVCKKNNISLDVVTELVIVQRERQHQERARGINKRFEEILGLIE
ncbi:DNA modification system-associated small protein [Janthinobacterium sp. LB2P70]|uniref:DNA modification system-associated small protein n=1 Tax=Janthinobacterium sp. LB2P70 TaxID=3424197 RepID=UPI003F2161FC